MDCLECYVSVLWSNKYTYIKPATQMEGTLTFEVPVSTATATSPSAQLLPKPQLSRLLPTLIDESLKTSGTLFSMLTRCPTGDRLTNAVFEMFQYLVNAISQTTLSHLIRDVEPSLTHP